MKKTMLKRYHISGAIFITGAICLFIFTSYWFLGAIGLYIGYEMIEDGIRYERKMEKLNAKKCCEGDCRKDNQSATPGNDGESKEGDN